MDIKLIILIFLSIIFFAFAPGAFAQEIEWTKQFGTALYDKAEDVSIDATSIYVSGTAFGVLPGQTNFGSADAFLRRYDFNGNEIWTRQFGGALDDGGSAVSIYSSAVYVAGKACGALPGQTSSGNCDAFIKKYDTNGNEIWTRQFSVNPALSTFINDISADSTGIYAVGVLGAGGNSFIRKYDFDGNEIWTRLISGVNPCGDIIFSGVIATSAVAAFDGAYIAGYTAYSLPGQQCISYKHYAATDAFIIKYDTNGNEIWTRQFGTSESDSAVALAVDSQAIYVAGDTESIFAGQTSAGSRDAFLRKYDFSGNVLWTRQFGTANSDFAQDIAVDSRGVYIAADIWPSSGGNREISARKYSLSGNAVWERQFGTAGDDNAFGIAANPVGIYVIGSTDNVFPGQTSAGGYDAFIAKIFPELKQFKSDGAMFLSEGETTTESTVVFSVFAFDPEGDNVKLQVELKEFNQPFDGQNLLESDGFVVSGADAAIKKENLSDGQYHWRGRAVDIYGNAGDWREFGFDGNVDFVARQVPLYTQLRSPYPSDEETRTWFNEEYANGLANTPDGCGLYIKDCGCAITSAVMILRYYGITTAIDDQNVNPLTINNWLNSNKGYVGNGNLDWIKVSEYSKEPSTGFARVQYNGRFDIDDAFGATLSDLQSITEGYVNSHKPVIIWSKDFGHFLVANEKLAASYAVRDPYWYDTTTLHSEIISGKKIRDYNNQFAGVRLYNQYSGPVDGISFNLASPAEFLITDPQGRRLGKDPITNTFYDEIPGGSYGEEGIANADSEIPAAYHKTKNIWISAPQSGIYDIKVIGTGAGNYTFDSLIYDSQGQPHSQTIASNTQESLVSDYNLSFTPGQPENINIQLISEGIDECPTLEGDDARLGCPAKIDFLSEEKISNSAEIPELIGPNGETRYTAPVVEGQRGTIEAKAKLYDEAKLLTLLGNSRSVPLDQLCAIFDDSTKDDALASRLVKTTDANGNFSFGAPSAIINYALIESVKEIIAGQSKRVCILETILSRHFDSATNIAFREVNQITLTTRQANTGEIIVKKTAGHNSQSIPQ